jgi:hypothetical protein
MEILNLDVPPASICNGVNCLLISTGRAAAYAGETCPNVIDRASIKASNGEKYDFDIKNPQYEIDELFRNDNDIIKTKNSKTHCIRPVSLFARQRFYSKK